MKRQIKFRAWDSIRMTTSGIMFNCSTGELCTPEGANMKLMQFTGLQDINGKDIYEGDILCVPHLENTRHQVRMVIEWDNDNAEFTKYRPKNAFEIIGNIYENPELLKTTENE